MLGILVRARCALVGAAVTAGAALLESGLAPVLGGAVAAVRSGRLAETTFDAALVWGCAAAAAVITCWGWLVALVVLLDLARGVAHDRRGVPAALRRALVVLCGAALATGLAAPTWADAGRPGPEVLRGLRLPERVAVPAPARPPRHARTVVVAPGDTLWALAAADLGPHPSPARVAQAWPRIYARNRAVIGADPGLLQPGQRLVLPRVGASRSVR